jgi:hypothetical protein
MLRIRPFYLTRPQLSWGVGQTNTLLFTHVMFDSDPARRLRSAFPKGLAEDARTVIDALPASIHETLRDIGTVVVRGEAVRIPSRIYHEPLGPSAAAQLTERQQIIAACLYTRHHSGFVRETALRRIIESEEPCVPPFVVQLLGEYVIEIVMLIADQADRLNTSAYHQFAKENERFLHLTQQRAISYWNCYFRRAWAQRDDYPGLRQLRLLESAGSAT